MDLSLTSLLSTLILVSNFQRTLTGGEGRNQLNPSVNSKTIEEEGNPEKSPRPQHPPFLEVVGSSSSQEAAGPGKPRGTLPLWQYVQEHGKRIEEDTGIRCICDTMDCVGSGQTTCTTTGSCYTQILELGDGSPPITRGCITGETPLLCENRIPKNSAGRPYPRLLCCKTHYCNNPHPLLGDQNGNQSRATLRPGRVNEVTSEGPWTETSHHPLPYRQVNMTTYVGPGSDDPLPKKRGREQETFILISPLAKAWLIGGAGSVVIISIIGFLLLWRERRRRPVSVGEVAAENVMNDVVTMDRGSRDVKVTGSELLLPSHLTLDSVL